MRILILSVPIGAGHLKAAHSIDQALLKQKNGVNVRFENCFDWVYPLYANAYKKIYDFAQKKGRTLLKFLYQGVGVKSGSSQFLYRMHRILAYHFRKLLEEFKPAYVLCTHFSPGYFAALYKKEFNYQIGIVVTDYYVHPHWVNKEIDHYFIPHEFLIDQWISYGAEKEHIFPVGIPVALELEQAIDKEKARNRFALSKERISVTVMGSRVFGGEWFEIVREIVDFDYDLCVLCGENKAVMEKIKKLRGRANLQLYGMVPRIYELIAVTDILITKAGGITTTEATKAAPCLLFANSIVGLEDKNEDFLIKHNAALRINIANARATLQQLLTHPQKMKKMRQNLKAIGKRSSAEKIAKVIINSCYDTH